MIFNKQKVVSRTSDELERIFNASYNYAMKIFDQFYIEKWRKNAKPRAREV